LIGFKGATREEAKGAEAPSLAKSKLRNKIKYRVGLIFLYLSDLKLRDLANLWLKNLLYDVIKITSPKIRYQNNVNFFFIY